jgi:hypothetical protein
MSGKLSVFAANALLGHVCGVAYSAPATVYVGVSTADPGVGLAEPVGNGYARAAIGFAAAAYRRVAQDGAATFAMATGAWGTVTHWALFDAASGGNMLAYGDFGQSKAIVAGNTLTIPADSIYVTFEPGGVGTATVHDLLDLMFGGVAYSAPATWLGVATETLGDATTGSTVAEPSGGGYGRVRVNVVGGAAPAWGGGSGAGGVECG